MHGGISIDSMKEIDTFETRERFLEHMRPLWVQDRQTKEDGSLSKAAEIFERVTARVAGVLHNKRAGLPVNARKLEAWQSQLASLKKRYPDEWVTWTSHTDIIIKTLEGVEKGLITEEDLRNRRISKGEL